MTKMDSAGVLAKLTSGPRFAERTEAIPGVGDITYRALSRNEVLLNRERHKNATTAEVEQVLVSLAMVSPTMTPDDVAAWQANSPAGELEAITRNIMHLSGMGANGTPLDQEAYKSVRS